jgi:hypothetical protein
VAVDKAQADRIAAGGEYDRDRRSGCFRRARGGEAADGSDYGHLAANQIGRQRWQPIGVVVRPAIFDLRLIVSANVLLGDLQARGIITLAERRDFALEWIKDYVRGCLPVLYRCKNADAVDRLGWFLKAN